ncbi:InlB B-repeat-containing protein, partial [Lacrimispora sp.]|uniref:InlB B-repeat-containing protein n=1 Tax=Lacrimispora sp. TaxID=2719234 RepID=UPI0028A586F7
DLNDGMSTEYHESVVPVGGKITDRPADPIRPGYLFKGWHSHLDENYEPVLWDFENNTVDTTMSLWASWEETRSVFYDLNDGMSTEYHESVVPVGEKITDRPADPTRTGYLFKGWYSYLDENYEPVLWDFDNNTVAANMSLWASWKEESDGSNNSGGNSGEGNSSSGGNNTEGNNSGSGNNTEGNNSNSGNSSGGGNSKGDGGRNETTTAGKSDKKGDAYGSSESVDIDEREVPKSSDTSNNSENLYIVKQEVPKDGMANLPKTGEDCTFQILHAALTLISLFVIFACLIYRKKTI